MTVCHRKQLHGVQGIQPGDLNGPSFMFLVGRWLLVVVEETGTQQDLVAG